MTTRSSDIVSLLRWGAASALVICAHGAVVWAAADWRPAQANPSQAPVALLIDLAAAPDKPQLDVAPGPDAAESVPQPEAKPEQQAMVDPVIELPQTKPRDAAVIVPPPAPEQQKPKQDREIERKPEPKPKAAASRAAASPTAQTRRADLAAAQAAGAAQASVASSASWRSELQAQLNRYKRYPAGASGSGTATIAFSVDRSGSVMSARLVQSSGDRALDDEAVALPRRASPLPAPPPGLGPVALNVPIRFNR